MWVPVWELPCWRQKPHKVCVASKQLWCSFVLFGGPVAPALFRVFTPVSLTSHSLGSSSQVINYAEGGEAKVQWKKISQDLISVQFYYTICGAERVKNFNSETQKPAALRAILWWKGKTVILWVETGYFQVYPFGGHTAVDTICYFTKCCNVVVNVVTAHSLVVYVWVCLCVCA